MAIFIGAYRKTLRLEGGYVLHKIKGDRGGRTYAGISRVNHPSWAGWALLDAGKERAARQLVMDFYRKKYWDRVSGTLIINQKVGSNLYDFAVNAGVSGAAKVMQRVCGVVADGNIGKKTLNAINGANPIILNQKFTLARIAYYHAIVTKKTKQIKFLMGWLKRCLSFG